MFANEEKVIGSTSYNGFIFYTRFCRLVSLHMYRIFINMFVDECLVCSCFVVIQLAYLWVNNVGVYIYIYVDLTSFKCGTKRKSVELGSGKRQGRGTPAERGRGKSVEGQSPGKLAELRREDDHNSDDDDHNSDGMLLI